MLKVSLRTQSARAKTIQHFQITVVLLKQELEILSQVKHLKSNLIKRIEFFKEETYKPLNEIQQNTIKQVKYRNKTVQDLKMEIEATKKTQIEGILGMKILENGIGTTDLSITYGIQVMEERISGIDDTVEKIDTSVKEYVKSKEKNYDTKQSRKSGMP